MFRRVGIYHDRHRYEAVLRELSKSGARIEGLLGVPEAAELVLDLGNGQMALCRVRRSQAATIAVEFARPLVSDGAGGLCTRHRLSQQDMAKFGLVPTGVEPAAARGGKPAFMQVDLARVRRA